MSIFTKRNSALILLTAFPLALMSLPSANAASKADIIVEKERKEGADAVALKKGDEVIKTNPLKAEKFNAGRIKGYSLKENLEKRKERILAIRRAYGNDFTVWQ